MYYINFPQKDKFTEETEKFVKEQSGKYKKWAERNKTDWIFERSSGYPGYRNTETGKWIYEKEYLEKFAKKELKIEEKLYTEQELFDKTLEALGLGMKLRQDQLNGWSDKSGNEVHKEWFNTIKK